MDIKGKLVAITLFLLVFLAGSGCSSTTSLANPDKDQLMTQVSVGDRIAIHTKSGERHVLNILAIDNEKIVGKKIAVKFDEIEKIEIKRIDRKKNSVWVIPVQLLLITVGIIFFQALF